MFSLMIFETTFLLMIGSLWMATQVINPLFTSLFLIMFSALASLIFISKKMTWLFLTTVIMFLGGMMVVFVYASSLSSSKKLLLVESPKKIIITVFIFSLLIIFSSFSFVMDYSITPSFIYGNLNFSLLILMAASLLLTLILLIKIVRWSEGPLKLQLK